MLSYTVRYSSEVVFVEKKTALMICYLLSTMSKNLDVIVA